MSQMPVFQPQMFSTDTHYQLNMLDQYSQPVSQQQIQLQQQLYSLQLSQLQSQQQQIMLQNGSNISMYNPMQSHNNYHAQQQQQQQQQHQHQLYEQQGLQPGQHQVYCEFPSRHDQNYYEMKLQAQFQQQQNFNLDSRFLRSQSAWLGNSSAMTMMQPAAAAAAAAATNHSFQQSDLYRIPQSIAPFNNSASTTNFATMITTTNIPFQTESARPVASQLPSNVYHQNQQQQQSSLKQLPIQQNQFQLQQVSAPLENNSFQRNTTFFATPSLNLNQPSGLISYPQFQNQYQQQQQQQHQQQQSLPSHISQQQQILPIHPTQQSGFGTIVESQLLPEPSLAGGHPPSYSPSLHPKSYDHYNNKNTNDFNNNNNNIHSQQPQISQSFHKINNNNLNLSIINNTINPETNKSPMNQIIQEEQLPGQNGINQVQLNQGIIHTHVTNLTKLEALEDEEEIPVLPEKGMTGISRPLQNAAVNSNRFTNVLAPTSSGISQKMTDKRTKKKISKDQTTTALNGTSAQKRTRSNHQMLLAHGNHHHHVHSHSLSSTQSAQISYRYQQQQHLLFLMNNMPMKQVQMASDSLVKGSVRVLSYVNIVNKFRIMIISQNYETLKYQLNLIDLRENRVINHHQLGQNFQIFRGDPSKLRVQTMRITDRLSCIYLIGGDYVKIFDNYSLENVKRVHQICVQSVKTMNKSRQVMILSLNGMLNIYSTNPRNQFKLIKQLKIEKPDNTCFYFFVKTFDIDANAQRVFFCVQCDRHQYVQVQSITTGEVLFTQEIDVLRGKRDLYISSLKVFHDHLYIEVRRKTTAESSGNSSNNNNTNNRHGNHHDNHHNIRSNHSHSAVNAGVAEEDEDEHMVYSYLICEDYLKPIKVYQHSNILDSSVSSSQFFLYDVKHLCILGFEKVDRPAAIQSEGSHLAIESSSMLGEETESQQFVDHTNAAAAAAAVTGDSHASQGQDFQNQQLPQQLHQQEMQSHEPHTIITKRFKLQIKQSSQKAKRPIFTSIINDMPTKHSHHQNSHVQQQQQHIEQSTGYATQHPSNPHNQLQSRQIHTYNSQTDSQLQQSNNGESNEHSMVLTLFDQNKNVYKIYSA